MTNPKLNALTTEELVSVDGGDVLGSLACLFIFWNNGFKQPQPGESGSECFTTTLTIG